MKNSEEGLLRKIGDSKAVDISEAVDPKRYKVNKVKEMENEWEKMHGHYVREKEGILSALKSWLQLILQNMT